MRINKTNVKWTDRNNYALTHSKFRCENCKRNPSSAYTHPSVSLLLRDNTRSLNFILIWPSKDRYSFIAIECLMLKVFFCVRPSLFLYLIYLCSVRRTPMIGHKSLCLIYMAMVVAVVEHLSSAVGASSASCAQSMLFAGSGHFFGFV